ncbi:MAG TPA: ATP-NAD kinase [Archaeoglobaceae archaeon]|nr:ATP-NAD kinase [Archaeoglobaceae archaeon]
MQEEDEVQEVLKVLHAFGLTQGYQEYKRLKRRIKIGFIVNPIAGMGGRVGLKGTDNDALKKAIELGAKPVSPARAVETLNNLLSMKDAFDLITYPGEMGENEAQEAGLNPEVIGVVNSSTTSEDTVMAASQMSRIPVNLLVFVGGDGTARDILSGLKNNLIPVLGIPSGVKMYSGVFAVNPQAGASIIEKFIRTVLPVTMVEVMDIDENEFRRGNLSARIFGYLPTPYNPDLIQSKKIATPQIDEEFRNQLEIAKYFTERMEDDTLYILCPGTSVYAIGKLLGIDKTLLGVDVVLKGDLIAKDVNEKQLLSVIDEKKASIVVTPIGGQGFIFGRGNQQIGPDVIRKVGKENIIVVSTRNKLDKMKNLRVDTGDSKLDKELAGEIKVITGYKEERVMRIQ